jgi:L-2-hydroxyglutarate oxidase LhgO
LALLTAEQLTAYEKNVRGYAGVLSPSTSIVDVHELMESFRRDCVRDGRTTVSLGDEVVEITRELRKTFRLKTKSRRVISAPRVVNAAGLYAHRLCDRMLDVYDTSVTPPPPSYFARGMYCKLKEGYSAPFQRLVYPLPKEGGLGIHFTRDVYDECKFGPDVEWIDDIDYTMDPARVRLFYNAIREYWPGLQDGALRPAFTGIRPKLINEAGDTNEPGATTDFVFQTESQHGAVGLVHLFGFESPGLTSCLSVGEYVADFLE